MSVAHSVETSSDLGYRARFHTRLGADRPLCFLHIAKTGGTSLTDALARLYAPDQVFSEEGNLWAPYIERLGDRLAGRVFLAGHAGEGVAARLQGRADIITLLRNPADQAVSNYLHVLADPDNALHADAVKVSFSDYLRLHDDQIDFQARSLALALAQDAAAFDALRLSPGALTVFLESLPFVGVAEKMELCAEVLSRLLPGNPTLNLSCINAAVYRGVSTRTLGRFRQDYLSLREDARLAPIFAREARLHARAEALLVRLDAALRSEAGAPTGAMPPGFIGATWFWTAPGVARGQTVVAPLASSAKHIIHGPYMRLTPGQYRARFHLRLEEPSPAARGPGRIELEAACNRDIRLGRRWLRPAAFARTRKPSISFTHHDIADVLEFRIRARGFAGGRLIFDGVTISPDAAAWASPSRVWRALSLARRGVRHAVRGFQRAWEWTQSGVRTSS